MSLQQRKATIETTTDNRQRRRHQLFLEVEARGLDSGSGTVIVHDISDTGLLIETDAELQVGEMIEVNLPQAGLMEAEIVWDGGRVYGSRFTRQLTSAAVSAARLGGRFTLTKPNSPAEQVVAQQSQYNAQYGIALNGELPIGAKLWIIFGLALSLWIIIGAITYVIMA